MWLLLFAQAPIEFAWLGEIYPKSWVCAKDKTASANRARGKGGKKGDPPQPPPKVQCGYKYEDVAAHPFAVLLPYSVHSYGLVQAYSMGVPIVAPSLQLVSTLHNAIGLMAHKGPGTPCRTVVHSSFHSVAPCTRLHG